MNKEKINSDRLKNTVDDTLKRLTTVNAVPKSAYFLLLLVYILATMFLGKSVDLDSTIHLLGKEVPYTVFNGIFSSLANVCIIFIVVFFHKAGFITAMIIMALQMPMLFRNIFIVRSTASIPGLFTNLFTIIACIVINANTRKIEQYQSRLREQAVTDALTGLPNRFACTELMNDLVKQNAPFAIVSIDLNNFKSINDTMGHTVGNLVLSEIAQRWKTLANSAKTKTNDFVTRLGGDEFALVVRGYQCDEDIRKSIKQYREVLENKFTIDNCDYFMTACFGYAVFPMDSNNSVTLLSCADAAMHELKRLGNSNRILHYSPELSRTEHVMEIERKIRTALENDSMFCYLQPQYDMEHKLYGFEALARMKDADGSFISPGDFIPVAENCGLIDLVDNLVFRKSAAFLSEVMKDGRTDIILSFNVSVRHLMKNHFIEEIQEIISMYEIPPENIEIEITESIMIDSADKALKCIEEVKNMGIKVAIDDFGTGYSSLSYLNRLPADLLKIDKSFIDGMCTSDSSKQYVAMIISIGHILNLQVISEGVETKEQLETLDAIGCDLIQGYVWGHPMPMEEARKLIAV